MPPRFSVPVQNELTREPNQPPVTRKMIGNWQGSVHQLYFIAPAINIIELQRILEGGLAIHADFHFEIRQRSESLVVGPGQL